MFRQSVHKDDIEKKKIAKVLFRKSQEIFYRFLESSKDPLIYMLNLEGQIIGRDGHLKNSDYFVRIKNRNFSTFFSPEDIELGLPDQLLAQALACGEIECEGWRVLDYRRRVWVSHRISVVRDKRGKALGYVSLFRDQTAQRSAMQALSESENRFRAMADNSPVLLWLAGPDGRCYFFNKPWLEFTGRSQEQEADFGWAEGVHPEDFQLCMETFVGALSQKREFSMEYRLRRYDGEYRWLYDQGVPRILEDGIFAGYVGSCIDITENKKFAEERELLLLSENHARRKAENLVNELQKLSQIKDDFLATVSHELRTPLNAIVGWSQLLKSGELDPQQRKAAIDSIDRNAHAQARLVNDLLDMSRVISGKISLDIKAIKLGDIIKESIDVIKTAADSKHIAINFYCDPSVGPIMGDADRLRQVMWNLFTNAVRHTPEYGCIDVKLQRNCKKIFLEIQDTGEGIDPEFLPYLFDRFRQEENSMTRQHGGLGIGLSLVKSLVEVHGGSVQAYSEGKGKGSRFLIELPLAAIELPSKSNYSNCKTDLKDMELLVVDDSVDALILMETILQRHGAHVYTAQSVREAMTIIEERKLDIVLTDISMPEESGYDLIKKIQNQKNTKKLNVVAITAHGRKEDIQHAKDLGFDLHITKPVDTERLINGIKSLSAETQKASKI